MAKRRTIYRDSKTGRFVKKSTWRRSRSAGGTRYKRSKVKVPSVRQKRVLVSVTPPAAPPAVFEWIVTIQPSGARSVRSLDIIVTAHNSREARATAAEFLLADLDGNRIIRAGRWTAIAARGNPTNVETGNAEYRSKSRASRKKRPN